MYGSRSLHSRNAMTAQDVVFVRVSKILYYENPYTVIGSIKQTGSQELPKDICKDKTIGTW